MCLKNVCTLVESTRVHIAADRSVHGQAITLTYLLTYSMEQSPS